MLLLLLLLNVNTEKWWLRREWIPHTSPSLYDLCYDDDDDDDNNIIDDD